MTTQARPKTVQEMHAALLRQLVNEMSARYDRVLLPLYPGVLVRVLPKEQERGGIILPDVQQNKPTAEGVVLAIYEPKELPVDGDHGDTYLRRCDVQPGDHVLFHAMHGRPAGWMDSDDYRILQEEEIFAVVQHAEHVDLIDYVARLLAEFEEGRVPPSLEDYIEQARWLFDKLRPMFGFVRKRQSVTLSGR